MPDIDDPNDEFRPGLNLDWLERNYPSLLYMLIDEPCQRCEEGIYRLHFGDDIESPNAWVMCDRCDHVKLGS